jgi:hypothetical protein
MAEAAAADDVSTTGSAAFAALVDDPASINDTFNAFLGVVILEPASAVDSVNVSLVYSAATVAAVTGQDAIDATITSPPPPTTSYANPGGTGNRTATITVTTTITLGGGTISQLVDGSYALNIWFTAQTLRTITFDFGAGASKYIDEFKWYQANAIGHGTWVFGGSNDDSSYIEFPETFTLGSAATQTVPVTNTSAYRYYRLRQTSGATNSGPNIGEIEFKIA